MSGLAAAIESRRARRDAAKKRPSPNVGSLKCCGAGDEMHLKGGGWKKVVEPANSVF